MADLAEPSNEEEEARQTLKELGFISCEGSSVSALYNDYWETDLALHSHEVPAWPEWQEDVNKADASSFIVEHAVQLGIIASAENRALPQTSYYDLGNTWFSLDSTKGRLATRTEYMDIYDKIAEHRSIIIVGQRGAGKSYLLSYCVLRRLSLGLPVMICIDSKLCFFFSKWGVWKLTNDLSALDDSTRHRFQTVIPAETLILVDGGTRPSGQDLPRQLWAGCLGTTTVFVCHPGSGQCDSWLNSQSPLVLALAPATCVDITRSCRLLDLNFLIPNTAARSVSFEKLLGLMEIYGRGTQHRTDLFNKSIEACRKNALSMIQDVGFTVIEQIFDLLGKRCQPMSLTVDSIFSTRFGPHHLAAINGMVVIYPQPSEDRESGENDTLTFEIASPWFCRQLADELTAQLPAKYDSDARRLVLMFDGNRLPPAVRGYVFENMMHSVLSRSPREWKERLQLEQVTLWNPQELERITSSLHIDHLFCTGHLRRIVTFRDGIPAFDANSSNSYIVSLSVYNPTFDAVSYAVDVDASEASESAFPDPNGEKPSEHSSASLPTRGSPHEAAGTSNAHHTRLEPRQTTDFDQELVSSRTSRAGSPTVHSHVSGSIREGSLAGTDTLPPESFESMSSCPTVGGPRSAQTARPFREPPMQVPHAAIKRPASVANDRDIPAAKKQRTVGPDLPPANKRHYVALQMTIAKQHTWSVRGFKLLVESFDAEGNWHFVVVVPKGSELDAKALVRQLRKSADVLAYAKRFRWYILRVDLADTDFSCVALDPELETVDVA